MCVDLHLHSIYSDGTSSPRALVLLARKHSLSAITLTDHDTIDGIEEILVHAKDQDLAVIPGLEISTKHREYTLHILGYGIDHQNLEFKQWLAELQNGRIIRNDKILTRLQQLGIDISQDELQSISCCGQAGRPHIAKLLIKKGIVDPMGQAFNTYLRQGALAWFDRFSYTTAESIDMIHQAGGVAVFAHPGQLDPGLKFLPLLIYELVERGLDGIEVYYPSQSSTIQKRLLRIADKYKLVVTGGSDYHGKNRTFSSMAGNSNGFCPPDSILPALTERIETFNIN